MALEIVWTREAELSLDDIIDYLILNGSSKEINKFFVRLEECLNKIKSNPRSQKNSLRNVGVKEFQHSAQTTIFYTFDETSIYILKVWSNRKSPVKLNA
jgi:plasmid stabilization system protein ParE